MRLERGDRLGAYEILAFLGAGGMGEVYEARHTRLDRTVAVKVLPADVASDPSRLQRLEREARILSRVSDPNIVTVYDVGTEGSTTFIAMEFVEGQPLSEVLRQGPLSLPKLLDVGGQIASGLASSHEAGVVHRDIKPANVVITKSGVVKILDFGLATRAPLPVSDSGVTTVSAMEAGKVGGTRLYMSPEQASDSVVDFRTDQFSLGVLLVEAATGCNTVKRPEGPATLREAVELQIDVASLLDPGTPPPLRWLVARCLARDPELRFASTRDLARDLGDIRDHISQLTRGAEGTALRLQSWKRQRLALWCGLGLLGLALAILANRPPQPPSPVFRFTIEPPPGTVFNFASTSPAPAALSADGRQLVFGARDGSGATRLWIRSLETMEQRSLLGTENAAYPFWSPDGRAIGFFADGKLKKIATAGGLVQTLADAAEGRGGTWSKNGVILFAPDSDGAILRIGPGSERPTPVTQPSPGVSHRWPRFLPDGDHFLYLERIADTNGQRRDLHMAALSGGSPQLVLNDASNAVLVRRGYLLFVRDGVLLAAPFDKYALRVTGAPLAVADGIYYHRYRLNGLFTAADDGVLAFQTGAETRTSRLVWYDRAGHELAQLAEPDDYGGLRLSPNGSRCAVEVRNAKTGSIDLWEVDAASGMRSRITSGGSINDAPNWSPDGRRILFSSNRGGRWDLYITDASGLGSPQVALASERDKVPTDWAPDGKGFVFSRAGDSGGGKWDVWTASLGGQARPVIETPFDEGESRFSPDGALLAYSSEASGQREVYVRTLHAPEREWRVSPRGGSQPIWRRDGRELFYVDAGGVVMAMPVPPKGFEVSSSVALFESSLITSASDIPLYDVAADGRRFLMNVRIGTGMAAPITILTGWAGPAKE